MKRMIRSGRTAKAPAYLYRFFVCDNVTAANRGMDDQQDTFRQFRRKFQSEQEAWEFAAYLIYGDDWAEWGDAQSIVNDQDPGAGWPVVYGICLGASTWIYKDYAFNEWEARRKGEW